MPEYAASVRTHLNFNFLVQFFWIMRLRLILQHPRL